MKFAITIFVLAILAQLSFNAASPYGYTQPQAPQVREPIANPVAITEPKPQVTPVTGGKTCGCGSGCSCGSVGPSSSCGCKGACQCGKPKPTPKPACGCGSGCSCGAKPGDHNCGCKKQASPTPSIDIQSIINRLRAISQSYQ